VNRTAARGAWGSVEWAVDASGSTAAKTDFENLNDPDAAKVAALFQRLADFGTIANREKFKSLGKTGLTSSSSRVLITALSVISGPEDVSSLPHIRKRKKIGSTRKY
jgi:hypothetical protein